MAVFVQLKLKVLPDFFLEICFVAAVGLSVQMVVLNAVSGLVCLAAICPMRCGICHLVRGRVVV